MHPLTSKQWLIERDAIQESNFCYVLLLINLLLIFDCIKVVFLIHKLDVHQVFKSVPQIWGLIFNQRSEKTSRPSNLKYHEFCTNFLWWYVSNLPSNIVP
jgi:hypothetical protein